MAFTKSQQQLVRNNHELELLPVAVSDKQPVEETLELLCRFQRVEESLLLLCDFRVSTGDLGMHNGTEGNVGASRLIVTTIAVTAIKAFYMGGGFKREGDVITGNYRGLITRIAIRSQLPV